MRILRGKDKGRIVEISQWCNNWFTSKEGKVYSVLSVQLNPIEMLNVFRHKNNGYMLERYELQYTGRFKIRRD